MANQGQMLAPIDFQAPGMVDLSAGPAAMARMLDIGVQGTATMAQTLNQHLATRSEFNGKLAGARDASRIDPTTGELMALDLPDPNSISIYDQAYRAQALQTYANVASIQAQGYANQIGEEFRADPVGATNTWEAYKKHVISNLAPEAIGLVQPDLINIGNQLISHTVVEQTQLDRDNAFKLGTQAQAERMQRMQVAIGDLAQGDGGPVTDTQVMANATKVNQTIEYQIQQDEHQLRLLQGQYGDTKFPEAYIRDSLIAERKLLWQAYVTRQAAAYANNADTTKTGKYEPDSDAAQNFANNIDKVVPPGLFSSDELTKMGTEAMTLFGHTADAKRQQREAQTLTDNTAYNNNFNDDRTRLEQALAQGNQDLDMTDLSATIADIKANHKPYDLNSQSSDNKLGDLLDSYQKKITAFDEDNRKWNIHEQHDTAHNVAVNSGHPFTYTGQGIDRLMLKEQRDTEVRIGAQVTADMDPELYKRVHLDDSSGSDYHFGHLYPREVDGFEAFMPTNDMDRNNRVLANYDAQTASNRGSQIMQQDAPHALDRMEAWRRVAGTKDPIGNFNLLMDATSTAGKTYLDGRKQAAYDYYQRKPGDPLDANANLSQAYFEAVQDSSYVTEMWNRMWGYPDIAGAKANPEAFRPGLVSQIVGGPAALLQSMWLAPGQGITTVFDAAAEKNFRISTMDAIARGKIEGPASNTTAIATMGQNNFGPSRMLFSPQFVGPLHDQALNATYVFGYASPEKWYGMPSYALVEDMSIKAMRGDWWKKAEEMNPGIIPMGGLPFLGFMGDLPPPGSPAFLKREFAEGNLRVQPHGIVNGRMEYDVMLRVQGANKDQWIPLNPQGEFWHYDMQAVGNYADAFKAAEIGADASRRLIDKVSPYLGDTIVGKGLATAAGHLYGEGKAWEAEYALKHQEYEAANAWWVEHHGVLQNLPEHFATSLPVE